MLNTDTFLWVACLATEMSWEWCQQLPRVHLSYLYFEYEFLKALNTRWGFFYTLTDSLTSLSLSVVNGFSNFYAHFD